MRFSIPFLRTYIVSLLGRERRSRKCRAHDRKFHPVATMGNLFVIAVITTVLSMLVFITGDGVKSWLGIDVASMGGVHATIEELHQNLVSAVKGM